MPSPAAVATATSKGRILIVDDEEEIRESLETLLELEGYPVETAPDGESGLEKADSGSFDLVLLDLMLPDRSGLEVVEEIRRRDNDTPVVMLTAYGSIENAVAAIKYGADDFFTKPWNNEKLLLEIDKLAALASHEASE